MAGHGPKGRDMLDACNAEEVADSRLLSVSTTSTTGSSRQKLSQRGFESTRTVPRRDSSWLPQLRCSLFLKRGQGLTSDSPLGLALQLEATLKAAIFPARIQG